MPQNIRGIPGFDPKKTDFSNKLDKVDIDWGIGCRFIQYLIASDHFFLFFFSTLTAFVAKFMSVYKTFLIATFG
jgi:hypothetical protein